MSITRIAILGAGTMGHGIAHAAMTAGYEVRLFDVADGALCQLLTSNSELLTGELGVRNWEVVRN